MRPEPANEGISYSLVNGCERGDGEEGEPGVFALILDASLCSNFRHVVNNVYGAKRRRGALDDTMFVHALLQNASCLIERAPRAAGSRVNGRVEPATAAETLDLNKSALDSEPI